MSDNDSADVVCASLGRRDLKRRLQPVVGLFTSGFESGTYFS